MNRKYCDACDKEIMCYNTMSPDRYKAIMIENKTPGVKDTTDRSYEVCPQCHKQILDILFRGKVTI